MHEAFGVVQSFAWNLKGENSMMRLKSDAEVDDDISGDDV
jgi:hypothetical protein